MRFEFPGPWRLRAQSLGLGLLLLSPLFFLRSLEDATVLPQRAAGLLGLALAFSAPLSAPSWAGGGPLFWMGVLFWAWRFLSHGLTPGPEPFLPWAAEQLVPAGAFVLGASAGHDPAWRRLALRWAGLGAALTAAYAALQLAGLDPWEHGAVDFGFSSRAHGSLGNPDFLAGYLLMVLPGLALAVWTPGVALAAASVALALALTQVRASLPAAAAGLLAGARAQSALSRRRWMVVLAALALLTALAWPRFQAALRADDSGLAGRRFMAQVGLNIANQHPWLGVGPGRFQRAYLEQQGRWLGQPEHLAQPYRFTADIHNDWVQVAAESGWPSLALLLALLGMGLAAARRSRSAALAGALAAFAVQACFHFPLNVQASALLFWGALGLLSARENPPQKSGEFWGWMGALALAALVLTLRQGQASAALNRGVVLKNQGRLAEAEALLAESVRLRPEDSRAWIGLGLVRDAAGKGPQAAESFRQATVVSPALPEAWANLALAAGKLNDLAASQAAGERALALNPRSPEAWSNLGKVRYLAGDMAGALRLFEEGLRQAGPNALLQSNAGALRKELNHGR
jgi:tetratricopeptide (TPR) repeat protein